MGFAVATNVFDHLVDRRTSLLGGDPRALGVFGRAVEERQEFLMGRATVSLAGGYWWPVRHDVDLLVIGDGAADDLLQGAPMLKGDILQRLELRRRGLPVGVPRQELAGLPVQRPGLPRRPQSVRRVERGAEASGTAGRSPRPAEPERRGPAATGTRPATGTTTWASAWPAAPSASSRSAGRNRPLTCAVALAVAAEGSWKPPGAGSERERSGRSCAPFGPGADQCRHGAAQTAPARARL